MGEKIAHFAFGSMLAVIGGILIYLPLPLAIESGVDLGSLITLSFSGLLFLWIAGWFLTRWIEEVVKGAIGNNETHSSP